MRACRNVNASAFTTWSPSTSGTRGIDHSPRTTTSWPPWRLWTWTRTTAPLPSGLPTHCSAPVTTLVGVWRAARRSIDISAHSSCQALRVAGGYARRGSWPDSASHATGSGEYGWGGGACDGGGHLG